MPGNLKRLRKSGEVLDLECDDSDSEKDEEMEIEVPVKPRSKRRKAAPKKSKKPISRTLKTAPNVVDDLAFLCAESSDDDKPSSSNVLAPVPAKNVVDEPLFDGEEEDVSKIDDPVAHKRSTIKCNHRKDEKYNSENAHTDQITCERLERIHCDWWSPDNELHLCFNASTVMDMARAKGFLPQPPHFREQADPKWKQEVIDTLKSLDRQDDLKLVESGDHFPRFVRNGGSGDGGDDDDARVFPAAYLRILESDYTLSSNHLVACPICYHHLKTLDGQDADDDPLEILSRVPPHMISCMVFKNKTDMIKHLKDPVSEGGHGLKPKQLNVGSMKSVEVNEVCEPYGLRKPDSIIHRWLSTERKGKAKRFYGKFDYDSTKLEEKKINPNSVNCDGYEEGETTLIAKKRRCDSDEEKSEDSQIDLQKGIHASVEAVMEWYWHADAYFNNHRFLDMYRAVIQATIRGNPMRALLPKSRQAAEYLPERLDNKKSAEM